PKLRQSAQVRTNVSEVAPELSRVWQTGGVDVVGQGGDDGLIGHAVDVDDEFRIDRADPGDQASGAQDRRLDSDLTQGPFDVACGCRRCSGLGVHRDQDVGVVATQCFTVVKAALQRGPGPRVQRYRVWSATEPSAA